jgi:hypothetical protein
MVSPFEVVVFRFHHVPSQISGKRSVSSVMFSQKYVINVASTCMPFHREWWEIMNEDR